MTRVDITPRQYDLASLLLRLVFGGFMLYSHGWPKLQRLFGDEPIKFADPFGIGPTATLSLTVFAEFLCAALILIGFKTRLATIPLMITMLVAAIVIHASDPFGDKEMSLIYLAGYIVIFLVGPGRYSVDERF